MAAGSPSWRSRSPRSVRSEAVPASTPVHVLAISGSLRHASSNGAILSAAEALAPPGVFVEIYRGLAALPHSNPDLDRTLDDPSLPDPVRTLRATVGAADALVISSPAYAHGVPGSLKNALDWLVGGSEMMAKPVALWNTAPGMTPSLVTRRSIDGHPRRARRRTGPQPPQGRSGESPRLLRTRATTRTPMSNVDARSSATTADRRRAPRRC